MANKIAIIGYGVVGKGMDRLLKRFEPVIYDPAQGYNDRDAVNACELGIICVPTPESADGACDTSYVESVIEWLETPVILIKSTVPPGTTTQLSQKYGKDVNFSPEYMGESTYFTPYWKYPDPERAETHTFVVVGGKSASRIMDYFTQVMSVDTKYMCVTAEEAELTKYMENSFFAVKVAFCNEFYEIAEKLGVDYKRLRELWLLDSRINPNHTLVFKDKRGYGGKCLPKDLSAIVTLSERMGYTPRVLKSALTWRKN